MKVSVLYLGRIECAKNDLIQCEDPTEQIKSPISAILIQHPVLGNVLYDTGNSPFYSSIYSEHARKTYPIPEFISIEEALDQKGLKPEDIDLIILSHLHFDHAGGLGYFRNAKALRHVMASEEEIKNAWLQVTTGNSGAYARDSFDLKELCFEAVQTDTKLADDVELFIQKSHTPGLIGLILHTRDKGTLICTGDTVYTRENWDRQLPPGGSINKSHEEFFDNLVLLKQLQKQHDASMIFGHDYDQIRRLAQESFE